MKKIFVTTFNKKLFDEYAHSLIETYIQTKQILPLYCYVEDDVGLYPKFENVFFYTFYRLISFLCSIVRTDNKVTLVSTISR